MSKKKDDVLSHDHKCPACESGEAHRIARPELDARINRLRANVPDDMKSTAEMNLMSGCHVAEFVILTYAGDGVLHVRCPLCTAIGFKIMVAPHVPEAPAAPVLSLVPPGETLQ